VCGSRTSVPLRRVVLGQGGDGALRDLWLYLDQAPVTWVSDRGGIRMTFHSEHRSIEANSRALETAGMLIETLREVVINDELAADDVSERRWKRIPLFLHREATRTRDRCRIRRCSPR
jgi:hypothetical protein